MLTAGQKVAVSAAYAAAMFMTVMDAAFRGTGLALTVKLKAMATPPSSPADELSRSSGSLQSIAATRRLRQLAGSAGIQVARAHPHMLRHTFVTTS